MTTEPTDAEVVQLGQCLLTVETRASRLRRLDVAEPEPGLFEVAVAVDAIGEAAELRLAWSIPCADAVAYWTPRVGAERWLPVSFADPYRVGPLSGAPAGTLHTPQDRNRLTFALSERVRPVVLHAGVSGATGHFNGWARLRPAAAAGGAVSLEGSTAVGTYEVTLRLDLRPVHFAVALGEVTAWWQATQPPPLPRPGIALKPMYSTWYSLGQQLDENAVETQARHARKLGCRAIIVDDGWQTADAAGGYASCGDWRPDPTKFPDLAAHVRRVHDLDMQYLLWFALPFAGPESEAGRRFADRMLAHRVDLNTSVLDPRHAEIRTHLVTVCVDAVRDWGLDGLKLDFIDEFAVPDPPPPAAGADHTDVEAAVIELLDDLIAGVRAVRPDVLVEFRQTYVGPWLWQYGNLLRVTDCALDATENRVHSIDLRLLAGPSAVHSDMLKWDEQAAPSDAARQLVSVLFSVPQLSMRLDILSDEHRKMLAHWLGLFAEFAPSLQRGTITPSRPDLAYPVVRADAPGQAVIATYGPGLVTLAPPLPARTLVVNGSADERLVLDLMGPARDARLTITDCRGAVLQDETTTLEPGPLAVRVPVNGTARIELGPPYRDRP